MTYSELKTGEFNLDFGVLVKTVGISGLQAENKIRKKCKIEPLEVLGHWGWIPRATEGFQGPFLPNGRMTYSHLPIRIFI